MKANRLLRSSAAVLLTAAATGLLQTATPATDEISDLSQAMSQAVEKASPAVVRVLVPEAEPRPRRSRASGRPTAPPREAVQPAESPEEKPKAAEPEGQSDKSDTPSTEQPAEAPAQPADKGTADTQAEAPDEGKTEEPAKPVKTTPHTGLIISADGYVITSLLSVGKAEEGFKVELADGRVLPAERLGEDIRRDVVLLKVNTKDLPTIEPARQSETAVGQWVLALGWSLPESGPTVSKGIISAFDRMAGAALQTDANTSAANYGGPLLDLHGRGIGMIAALSSSGSSARAEQLSDSGIGFAVPLEDILSELPELKAGKRIAAAFLGIGYNWARLGEGAMINRVIPGTAAAECGVKVGDIIIDFDDVKVASPFQIGHLIGSHKVGDKVTFNVIRGEETLTLKGTLKARPEYIRE